MSVESMSETVEMIGTTLLKTLEINNIKPKVAAASLLTAYIHIAKTNNLTLEDCQTMLTELFPGVVGEPHD